jgi:hypothetical protein
MGYYLDLPKPHNKATQLIQDHGAKLWDPDNDVHIFRSPIGVASRLQPVLICVVENPAFDAALICFDEQEYYRTTNPEDMRPRTYLTLPLEKVFELAPPVIRERWGRLRE